jgi:hypothetical protein
MASSQSPRARQLARNAVARIAVRQANRNRQSVAIFLLIEVEIDQIHPPSLKTQYRPRGRGLPPLKKRLHSATHGDRAE